MIRALIVDDEPLAREYLRSLLAEQSDCEIVGECADGTAAIRAIRDHAPDVVFLDVQMPKQGGLEVIEVIGPDSMPVIVFVTAFDRYAVDAFERHALDYLLKPFSEERFAVAWDRVRTWLARSETAALTERLRQFAETFDQRTRHAHSDNRDTPEHKAPLTRIPIKDSDRIVFVDVDDLDWVESADYCVNLHCGAKVHLLRESMHWLEERLDPEKFVRIHRGAIVRVDRIKELRTQFGGDYQVILHDGTKLKLSRRRKEDLERVLGRSF